MNQDQDWLRKCTPEVAQKRLRLQPLGVTALSTNCFSQNSCSSSMTTCGWPATRLHKRCSCWQGIHKEHKTATAYPKAI
eukprot:4265823-Amphidinium_carterae.1